MSAGQSKDAATIVLLPGMDGSGFLFSDFAAVLDAKVVIASYPTDRPLGYAELEEFVRALLPADEPFILLGESFSGPIAISLASSRPPGLRAVILACSFAKLPAWLRPFRAVSALPFWRMPEWIIAGVLLGRYGSDSTRARLLDAVQRVSPPVWKSRLHSVVNVDVGAKLAELQVPLLYLLASEDRVVSRSASRMISQKAPGAKIVELEGPHCLLQTKPDQAAAVVRAFAMEIGIELAEQ